jgi:hypothetical protein
LHLTFSFGLGHILTYARRAALRGWRKLRETRKKNGDRGWGLASHCWGSLRIAGAGFALLGGWLRFAFGFLWPWGWGLNIMGGREDDSWKGVMGKNKQELLKENLKAMYGDAQKIAMHLGRSLENLGDMFPLDVASYEKFSDREFESVDAFRVRFMDLQDFIGNKLFKSLLKVELEELGSMLDVVNKMEKRRIIHSAEQWHDLRNIRNSFSHEYPESEKEKLENLGLESSWWKRA